MIHNRLSELMGAKRIEISELAKLAKLDARTVRKIFYNENKYIDMVTLNKLCWALDCNTQDIFRYKPDDTL